MWGQNGRPRLPLAAAAPQGTVRVKKKRKFIDSEDDSSSDNERIPIPRRDPPPKPAAPPEPAPLPEPAVVSDDETESDSDDMTLAQLKNGQTRKL